ncbi:MAG: family 43 glycosylhydrolase [Bacteroidales bacterium]|nr:family 43 glycosylhydrolase [Bacteroidales bacterium]
MKELHVCVLTSICCLTQLLTGFGQSPSFKTYMNPVIPGDHPDCTISRIGNDFYTTGSSFNPTPKIYHSTDLVHWEAIARPVSASWANYGDAPGGGCWGGHMVFYKGKYWDFFGRTGTMYFVTAEKPEGPWSTPTQMICPASVPGLGADNSIFIDSDSTWYLLVKNGQPNNWILQLGPNGQPSGNIYNLTWLNPAPDYPYSWAEGPVMWKYDDYYYYSFARNLAGGQKIMRSTVLTGDQSSWEMLGDFFNESDPLKPGSRFTSPNHCSNVIMLNDSTSWTLHPLYAKGEWKGQGRQGLLNQVRYNANSRPVADYPVDKPFTAPNLPSSGIPWMVPKSDFFSSDELNPEWSFLGRTLDNTYSLTDRPGWLRLTPKSSKKANTVIKYDGEHNYSLITRLEFDPESITDEAGLRIMRGDESMYVKLYSTVNEYGHKVVIFSFENINYEADNTLGNTLWLRIIRVNHSISGYFSSNGQEWFQVGQNIDVSKIDSYSDFVTFTGTLQGLYVKGSKTSYFDLYIYRDAYTPILAECPANQSGTVRIPADQGISVLDDIHNNDWVMYAGVEFGNNEYLKAPKIIEVTASSGSSGGIVEVWLDSIDTGTKVAGCTVSNTGDWNTFETFSAPVSHVEGRHDVYLRFTGADNERLCLLKWIKFIAETAPELVSASMEDDDTLQLKLSQPVVTPSLPSGLTVEINDTLDMVISDISLAQDDSSRLIIALDSAITYTDKITISYTPGTITNSAGISLMPFSVLPVDNLLPGAIPGIKLLETKHEGDTVWMHLSKKMNSPASYTNDFTIIIEGKEDIPIKTANVLENDSAVIILLPDSRIHYEDMVSMSYTGTGLESVNGGALDTFTFKPVQNTADGYPPDILSAVTRKYNSNFRYIDLTFDKPLLDAGNEISFFSITINDVPATIGSLVASLKTLSFDITPYVLYGDVVKISYSGGNVRSKYNGKLQDFSDYPVTNTVPTGLDINPGDDKKGSEILAFPNPSCSEIQISCGFLFHTLTIFSIEGRTLVHKEYAIPVRTAHLSTNLKAGIYIIMLSNDSTRKMNKIIME